LSREPGAVQQVFSKWLKLVQSRQHKPKVPDLDLDKMRVGQLVELLNAKQARACAAADIGEHVNN